MEARAAAELQTCEDEWSAKLGEYISRNAQLRVEVKQATRRATEAEKVLEAANVKMAELQKAFAELESCNAQQAAALAKSNKRVEELEQRPKPSSPHGNVGNGGDFSPAFSGTAGPMASPEYANYLDELELEDEYRGGTFSAADEDRALQQIDAKASPGGHFSAAPEAERDAILASLNAAAGPDVVRPPMSRDPSKTREPHLADEAINGPKDVGARPAKKPGFLRRLTLTGSKSTSALKYPKAMG